MNELRFKIDAFKPDTIPMARLAEYMKELADLLGSEQSVHFVRLDEGSVELVHRVDWSDQPKVEARLLALHLGDASPDTMKAYNRLDDLLANDNATGRLQQDKSAPIIEFPGRNRPKPVRHKTFTQQDSLDGIPIVVGGTADKVPVHLQNTDPSHQIYHCTASREIARGIAAHIFETPIRVHGAAQWRQEGNGGWSLVKFEIDRFEILDDAPLEKIVEQLRTIHQRSDWCNDSDPQETLRRLRGGEDQIH